MCGHIGIAFLSLCFAALTLAVPPPVKCPAASQGCSKCVATVGCSFVASYGSTLDNCQLAATAALAPASAIYTNAAQCTAFNNAFTQWNNIKSHVLQGDKPSTARPVIRPMKGRHLLSTFYNKNGGLKTQLRDIGNVNTATKIMSISLPDKTDKTLWVDESGATTLELTTLTEPFWSSNTVQQVCLAAITASLMHPRPAGSPITGAFAVDSPIVANQRLCIQYEDARTCFPDNSAATMTAARAPCP